MKKNDSRALARLKRMYRVFKDGLFVKDGKKWRPCESITEFLELKWVKKLKNTGSIEKHPLDKLDAKMKNRKERHSKRKQIQEGLQEHNAQYDETCNNCEHFTNDECFITKESVYVDSEICKDFKD